MTAARDVYGVTTREVANLLTFQKEEEIEKRREKIKVAVRRKNERMQGMDARRRLRPKKEDGVEDIMKEQTLE